MMVSLLSGRCAFVHSRWRSLTCILHGLHNALTSPRHETRARMHVLRCGHTRCSGISHNESTSLKMFDRHSIDAVQMIDRHAIDVRWASDRSSSAVRQTLDTCSTSSIDIRWVLDQCSIGVRQTSNRCWTYGRQMPDRCSIEVRWILF